jgi:phenylpropionate dioxygenase-like ring-hydroxylating dioxygenase large terminal subunit
VTESATFAPASVDAVSGIRVQAVLATDAVPPPSVLLQESQIDLGTADIPVDRYVSEEWQALEYERVWRRVWQMACRLEEISAVGDHVVYEIGEDSLIVVRSSASEIKAFHNSCLHRGTELRNEGGHVARFRCPFHGFTWDLDGSLRDVPSEWDFPTLRRQEWCLPEVQVGTWGGFVFVSLDPTAPPLAEYLEIVPQHLAHYRLEDRYKAVHVSQVVPCNWKVALDAFFEGYHVGTTHPQTVRTYDTAVQYDVWPDVHHTSRLIMLGAAPSPHVRSSTSEVDVAQRMQAALPPEDRVEVGPGERARPKVAEAWRRHLGRQYRADLSGIPDSDVLDQIQYYVFPNLVPWPAVGSPLTYRFRPNGTDPHSSIMEVMFLWPRPGDGSEAAVASEIRLEPGQPWSSVPELGEYGPVFDQDMPNLSRIQRGLRASRKRGVTLGRYQESRIRHYHRILGCYMGESPPV